MQGKMASRQPTRTEITLAENRVLEEPLKGLLPSAAAAVDRFLKALGIFSKPLWRKSDANWSWTMRELSHVEQLRSLVEKRRGEAWEQLRLLRELATYTVRPVALLSPEELQARRDRLAQLVPPQDDPETYYAAAEEYAGRPVVSRYVAARALTAKRANPRLTRSELAQQFCPCGNATHDKNCTEQLRRDLKRLSALIQRILHNYPA